jgi:hypothetical protein
MKGILAIKSLSGLSVSRCYMARILFMKSLVACLSIGYLHLGILAIKSLVDCLSTGIYILGILSIYAWE